MDKINRIVVFDWDNTICISPENTIENRTLWESVRGEKWRHKGNGWWSKLETLDYEVFDIKLVDYVKESVIESINNPYEYTVLLTGRIPKFADTIKVICEKNGIGKFDAYYFNDSHDTLKFKLSKLEELKNMFPNVKEFVMWEDRIEHIPYFEEWGVENYGSGFKMNIVAK